ncbi:MAG: stage II sporulation protein D [Clostridia bacterium]
MKKGLVFLCAIFFSLSVIFIIYFKLNNNIIDKQKVKKTEENIIENKSNMTIRVKISKTGEIIAMDINDYLKGVVPSEMPPSYNIEALKAQAVVARTYTFRKMQDNAEVGADICDDFNHCQVYNSKEKLISIWKKKGYSDDLIDEYINKINIAVSSTSEVIKYNGEYIKAFFHASSPIKTEDVSEIWGRSSLPYLVSVDNVEDESYINRYSCVSLSLNDISNKINVQNITKVNINSYTASGRVKDVLFNNTLISAEKLRILFGLKSTFFTIDVKDNIITFNVTGYGHGVGMSQVGANYLANKNYNYIDIIKYYYKNVSIENM